MLHGVSKYVVTCYLYGGDYHTVS